MGSRSRLQIFPTQGWTPGLPQVPCRQISPAGKPNNTGVGSLPGLPGIFPTQESNWGRVNWRQTRYQLSYRPRLSVKEPGRDRGKESGVWRLGAAPRDAQPRRRAHSGLTPGFESIWTVLVLPLPRPKHGSPACGPELAPGMHGQSLRMLAAPSGLEEGGSCTQRVIALGKMGAREPEEM